MVYRPALPSELWLLVFHYAADCPKALYPADYTPFEPDSDDMEAAEHMSLAIKRAIVLVCRRWRDLGEELLYEGLHIHHGVPALCDSFEHGHGCDLARRVRRAVLPYTQTQTPTYRPVPALSILTHCPHLEVLVRPCGRRALYPQFEFSTDAPKLPALKRLEWWQDNSACCTGGINSLDDVLKAAPHVQYLTFGGQMFITALRQQQRLHLPELHTLRLRAVNAIAIRQLCFWSTPVLDHLILDDAPSNAEMLDTLWENVGEQLQAVELGRDEHFRCHDYVATVLTVCPGVRELNCRVLYTAAPSLGDKFSATIPHTSLNRIGLHAVHFPAEAPETLWDHLRAHFSAYSRDAFPGLREFALYGEEWSSFCADPRFREIQSAVKAAERTITFAA
ncbi:unnamed protein product [Peniophora sp. CBMAI 1063]|nr:unnamed protein product [Peniophora sp. CBMAI 1063]